MNSLPTVSLDNRIEYGKKVNNDGSKILFSLEPTLRFVLSNYLVRQHKEEVDARKLSHITDSELIRIFVETADTDPAVNNRIYKIHQAITDFRIITFHRRHRIVSETIEMKSDNLKSADYYIELMEQVIQKLSTQF